jgi:hypothetical protein
LPATFVWALGHYLVFAAVAALGAGLQVTVGALSPAGHIGPMSAAFTVAIPVAVYLFVLGALDARLSSEPVTPCIVLLSAVLVLAAAAATRVLPLPASIVIMMASVALMVAYHLIITDRRALNPSR